MRRLLYLAFLPFFFLLACGLIAPYFISVTAIKNQMIHMVELSTGRKLTIEGDIKIKFFPTAGIVIEKVALSNPSNFNDDYAPFIALDELKVDVAILPLFHKNIEIESFVLESPKINLHLNKAGIKNWEMAKKSEEKVEPASATPPKMESGTSSLSMPSNFRLSDVSIKNGSVTYIDDNTNTKRVVDHITAQISLNDINSPLKLEGSGQWSNKAVTIKARVETPQTLLNKGKTGIELDISSDLLGGTAQGSIEGEVFAGKAAVKSPSIKETLAWLNPGAKPMATPARLAVDVRSDVRCGNNFCDLEKLVLSLDKINASGRIKIGMADTKPSINLDLSVDELDLNPFLAAEKHADNSGFFFQDALAQAENGRWGAEPIDLSALKAFGLEADIKTEAIRYRNIKVGACALSTKIQHGRLTTEIKNADFYKGKVNVAADVNSAVTPVAISIHASLKEVQVEPLLTDTAQMDRVSGKADITLDVTSHGSSQQAIISDLAGSGQLKMSDGVLKGVNIPDMLHNFQGAFAGGGNGSKDTAISALSGSFVINHGVLNNQDLVMQLTGLSVTGKGDINLPAYTINYRLAPQLMGKGQTGEAKGGLSIPVIVQGSLDRPSFKPDVNSVIQNAINDPKQLKEQLKNNERSIKEQLKNPKDAVKNLKGLLKGLQGN